MTKGESILFPNLFPYGKYSAVSIFDQNHFVEIGSASAAAYANSFKNSIRYIKEILDQDPKAVYVAITQNHLPSAGGSLVHPHLQINADRYSSNHHRFFNQRCGQYYQKQKTYILSDYLGYELKEKKRYIGTTGEWYWVAAFAPEGFFEIWGILPGVLSVRSLRDQQIADLCTGILSAQRFYRSLNRNGYNLGLLSIEKEDSCLELRTVMVVRSNYAQWVRNDHTGFEVMLGDMATFSAPEHTAALARPFWPLKQ
jgi:galactose-1-phosphate uridylyltransferase